MEQDEVSRAGVRQIAQALKMPCKSILGRWGNIYRVYRLSGGCRSCRTDYMAEGTRAFGMGKDRTQNALYAFAVIYVKPDN